MNKRIAFSVFLVMLCVTLLSCAHGSKMRKLYPGMTKQEVLKTLGKPVGYQKAGEYEAFKYANKLMSGWSWDRADYHSIIKDGILVEYGAGNIRVKDKNIIVLVPLR